MSALVSFGKAVLWAGIHFKRDRCFDRAAVISYFALLSFLPLAVLLVTLGALALGSTEAAENGTTFLMENVLQRLPPQVMDQVQSVREQAGYGWTFLILVLWTASKVFSKVEAGLDHVFQVDKRRSYPVRKVFALGLVLLLAVAMVFLILAASAFSAVDRFVDTTALAALKDWPVYDAIDGVVTRYFVPWAMTLVFFFFIYWVVPACTVPWRMAALAALVAGTLFEGLKLAFAYYVANLASYTRMYGALETVVVFVIWINLSASLLLWGGELAAITSGLREPASEG